MSKENISVEKRENVKRKISLKFCFFLGKSVTLGEGIAE
jgi:hypothetical protein